MCEWLRSIDSKNLFNTSRIVWESIRRTQSKDKLERGRRKVSHKLMLADAHIVASTLCSMMASIPFVYLLCSGFLINRSHSKPPWILPSKTVKVPYKCWVPAVAHSSWRNKTRMKILSWRILLQSQLANKRMKSPTWRQGSFVMNRNGLLQRSVTKRIFLIHPGMPNRYPFPIESGSMSRATQYLVHDTWLCSLYTILYAKGSQPWWKAQLASCPISFPPSHQRFQFTIRPSRNKQGIY